MFSIYIKETLAKYSNVLPGIKMRMSGLIQLKVRILLNLIAGFLIREIL